MKRASRHARTGKPAAGGKNKRYFPYVDTGNHKYFNQITVPPAPAPVKAIVRGAPDCYVALMFGEGVAYSTFRQALGALYPKLPAT